MLRSAPLLRISKCARLHVNLTLTVVRTPWEATSACGCSSTQFDHLIPWLVLRRGHELFQFHKASFGTGGACFCRFSASVPQAENPRLIKGTRVRAEISLTSRRDVRDVT